MRDRWSDPSNAFKITLGTAGVLYLLYLPSHYVGFFSDDATYILGAQSLLQGHYVSLHHPLTPPLTQFPPGYSLFLAPFVKLIAPHWNGLRLTSIALTLASVILLWNFLKVRMSPGARWMVCAMFALNPLTIRISSAVLSEPLYLCLTLLTFQGLDRCLGKTPARWAPWLLGAVVGWASIVRTLGVLLIPAMGLSLAYARRWRVLAHALPLALLPAAFLTGFNRVQTGKTTAHSQLLQTMMDYLAEHGAGAWLEHLHRLLNLFFVYGLTALELPYTPAGSLVSIGITLILLALAGMGLFSFLKKGKLSKPLILCMLLYLSGYLGIYSFWLAIDGRYVVPILPFLVLAVVEGGRIACRYTARPRIAGIALCGVLAVSYGYRIATLLQKTYSGHPSPNNRLPGKTYAWIREHLPPEACLLDPKAPVVYLYTQRRSITSISAPDIEDFRYRVSRAGITHAFSQPLTAVNVRRSHSFSEANPAWLAAWPDAFPVVYQNPDEQTRVYRIVRDPAYQKAYELYLMAHHDLMTSDTSQAKSKLEQVLQDYPSLACAHVAYGTLLFLTNQDLAAAERHLLKALSRRPYYPLALRNLARLYQKKGQHSLARDTYQKALDAIPLSGEAPLSGAGEWP